MPKRRNESVERSVLVAAWDLFMEKGYQGTSYTDIAELSGVSRSLVQYYFPKKDLLALTCGKAIVIASHVVVRTEIHQDLNQVASAYITGQVLLAALFLNKGSQRFLFDILRLAHRAFAVSLDQFAAIPDKAMMVAGGLGELAYYYLAQGIMPDVSSLLKPGVLVQASIFGLVDETTPQQEQAMLAPYALSNETLAPLAAKAMEYARTMLLEQGDVSHFD